MGMSRAVPLLAAAVLAVSGGCGWSGLDSGPESADPRHPREPNSPPPEVQPGLTAPPPAWVESERSSRWLGYSSYCWESTCADFVERSCHSRHVPKIALRRGEVVRFHLGFRPRAVRIAFERPGGGEKKLEAAQVTSWRVDRAGVVSLSARARDGDASYIACIRLR